MSIDTKQFETAIKFLGATMMVCVLGIIVLAGFEKPIPDVLQNIAIGTMTGLVGLLVQKRPDESNPIPVSISPQSEPVVTVPATAAETRTRRRSSGGHIDVGWVLVLLLAVIVLLLLVPHLR